VIFEEALFALRAGQKVKRACWDRMGISRLDMRDTPPENMPKLWDGDRIVLRTAAGDECVWIPSQKDILAEDWVTA
jgi:uncharacterized protein DUF2829